MFEADDKVKDKHDKLFGTVVFVSNKKREFTVEWESKEKLSKYPFKYYNRFLFHEDVTKENNPNLSFKRERRRK